MSSAVDQQAPHPESGRSDEPSSRKSRSDCPGPTVIIPVHNAHDELAACLRSVAETVSPESRVVVIDDASTDSRIVPLLNAAVAAGGAGWRFERQGDNRGFVATANRGMQLTAGDVVLLNSDTEVTPGWLERIGACLSADPRIATCTPWSNNGEIVSIPRFCSNNPVPAAPDEIGNALARAVARRGGPTYPELPTAVGFCMGISRRAIDAVGLFDAERFGRGYGEENDFSLRARAAGFRNVLCDDVFVVHHGGRSFGPLGLEPDEGSMQRLLARHPGYREEVRAFIEADPLAALREALCAAVIEAGRSFE